MLNDKMKRLPLIFLIVICTFLSACDFSRNTYQNQFDGSGMAIKQVSVVPFVDLNRYLGTWYEIARYPHSFEEGCYAAQAKYSLEPNGTLQVVNQCWLGDFDGEFKEARGKAWVVDKQTNAKLKVQFFWPFSGNYWILDLDEDYRYALVGDPSREYLWILSRSPKMDSSLYDRALTKIKEQGYDASRLISTPQLDL